jgi:hypothetical protein
MELASVEVNKLLDVSCHNVFDSAVDPIASLAGRPTDVHFSSIPLMLYENALFLHNCFHDLQMLMFVVPPLTFMA